jgi:hypothetical protein
MSTKALSWLFLILTILNLPVMLFYFNGSGGTQKDVNDLAIRLSLGNVGESSQACGERNIAQIENDKNYDV